MWAHRYRRVDAFAARRLFGTVEEEITCNTLCCGAKQFVAKDAQGEVRHIFYLEGCVEFMRKCCECCSTCECKCDVSQFSIFPPGTDTGCCRDYDAVKREGAIWFKHFNLYEPTGSRYIPPRDDKEFQSVGEAMRALGGAIGSAVERPVKVLLNSLQSALEHASFCPAQEQHFRQNLGCSLLSKGALPRPHSPSPAFGLPQSHAHFEHAGCGVRQAEIHRRRQLHSRVTSGRRDFQGPGAQCRAAQRLLVPRVGRRLVLPILLRRGSATQPGDG